MASPRAWTAGRSLFGLALVAFVALGLPDGTLGVAWPSMRADLDRSLSALGVLLVAQTCGYLVASAGLGALAARVGTGMLLVGSAGASAVGLAAFATTSSWAALVAASVVIGVAAGLLDAGLNAHVALHHGRRAMGLLHAAFGIGATAGPLLVTALVAAEASWRFAYVLLAVVQVALFCAFGRTAARWRTAPAGTAPAGTAGAGAHVPEAGRAWRRRALAVAMAAFFVYTGLEIATGQWAYSLLVEARGTSASAAGLWVASYWGALTVGRLVLAVVGDRLEPALLLSASGAATVSGGVLLWLDPLGLGAAALPVVGLGLAPVFPTLVSLTPARFGADRAAHAVGYQLAAAGVGAAVLPGAVALAIEAGGLGVLAPSLTAMALVLAALDRAAGGTAST